jgi:hypothetical protein
VTCTSGGGVLGCSAGCLEGVGIWARANGRLWRKEGAIVGGKEENAVCKPREVMVEAQRRVDGNMPIKTGK